MANNITRVSKSNPTSKHIQMKIIFSPKQNINRLFIYLFAVGSYVAQAGLKLAV